MMLFDTHAHLYLLQHCTPEEAVANALQQGVGLMNSVSTEPSNWDSNAAFARKFSNVFYTLGVHPHEAKDFESWSAPLKQQLAASKNDKKLVGIGETGLDFYYKHSDKDTQLRAFEFHLELAKEHNLPVVIHCRDAFQEVYQTIEKIGLPERAGVMHCFTGNSEQAMRAIELGLYISFSGIVTFKNATDLRLAARDIPLEKILLETDCPFLAPIPHRGEPNEPKLLRHTAQQMADIRQVSLEKIAEITTKNAERLFATMKG